MNILNIINKKRLNEMLTNEEIDYFVQGYVKGTVPDYQASALLMAICINGLNEDETFAITKSMINSGETLDLHKLEGIKVDKHSTGGVSDTTSIAVAPILACAGLKIVKMSGGGLGFTGGTTDKLEVFKGIKTQQSPSEIIDIVNKTGCIIVKQSDSIVPADKKLYTLRDITSTIQSIPLIASSVMSKKIASGNDIIFLDVKVGKDAFMENEKDAIKLAKLMIKIGEKYNKKVAVAITDMNQPLGNSIGCSLEVEDAVDVLNGAKGRLYEMIKFICTNMMQLSGLYTLEQAEIKFNEIITTKCGLNKLEETIRLMGGDFSVVDDFKNKTPTSYFKAHSSGYIYSISGKDLGYLVCDMGGGRKKLTDHIDLDVGIRLLIREGDFISQGDKIAEIYNNEQLTTNEIAERLSQYITISPKKPKKLKLIKKFLH